MQVALVSPPLSGKTTLFAAVAQAGGSTVRIDRPDQPHLAVVKVPDDRVLWLAELYKPKKITFAEIELLDLPGLDLASEAGRTRARAHWGQMRQSDMLVFVVREFDDPGVPAYRDRIDPPADVDELLAEMLFADLDQVATRIERLETSSKKPTANREQQLRELELMRKLLATLEAGKPISSAVEGEAEEKMVRSFAFLSNKPAVVVLNCSEDTLGGETPADICGLPCLRLSAKIEHELSLLGSEDRQEFLADLGLQAPAGEVLVRACYEAMDLASFLTVGEDECRAWTIPSGVDAVTAAGKIHSDIARGFIRAEVVAYDDLRAAGDMKAAKAAGKVRLEGKTYAVRDGDVINFRFNV